MAKQTGACEFQAQAGALDGGQHVLGCGREVLPHALLSDLQERDREGLRPGPLLRRDHQLGRPGRGVARRPVQMVDGSRWCHIGEQISSKIISRRRLEQCRQYK